MIRVVTVAALLVGCKGDPDPPRLLDTGWFTTEDVPDCLHTVAGTLPEDGTTDWYYRDAPRVFVSTADPGGYEAWLSDAEGRLVETNAVWSAEDSAITLVPDEPLAPDTDFELVVKDCVGTTTVTFSTSEFGLPLTGGLDLAGRTYRLNLGGARWQRPEGLGPIIGAFLTEPVLLGVVFADDAVIDLLGSPSNVDDLGVVSQAESPSWDFPLAAFDPADPTFSVSADHIELLLDAGSSSAAIPVTGFALSGTLSGDGQRLGGGRIEGEADTREFAAAFLDGENAACELVETSFQLSCSPCPSDGEPFCLALEAESVRGILQPGLTLVARAQ